MDTHDAEGTGDASNPGCQYERAGRKTFGAGGINHALRAGPPAIATERLAAWTGLEPRAAHSDGQAALPDDLTHFHRSRYISAGRIDDYGQFPVTDASEELAQIARRSRIDHAFRRDPVHAALGPTVAGAGIGMNEHELHGCAGHLGRSNSRQPQECRSRYGSKPTSVSGATYKMP
ncbi:hypothetical protein ACXHXG_17280 [Rhizobium sp. LEGMi198b]|nr:MULTISPECIES: hypothetical protein [Rhizobium]UWU20902.1 hypothetical protein N2601_16805 [Rhizobium tropici]